MSEFNFKGGCGFNDECGECQEGSLCTSCFEAWSCQIKYENTLEENKALQDKNDILHDDLYRTKERNAMLVAAPVKYRQECELLRAFVEDVSKADEESGMYEIDFADYVAQRLSELKKVYKK